MVAAVLAAVVVWCLFYGWLPQTPLTAICIGVGSLFALSGKLGHAHILSIDTLAQSSRLNRVNAGLKLWTVLALMSLCIAARSPVVGILLAAVILVLIVTVGGLKLYDYIRFLALPLTFLLMSGLALLFEVTRQPVGVLHFHLWGLWFCVTAEAQGGTMLVMARALGAVSCLYLLNLTTPMAEMIGVLRRAHCPGIIISLMYLTYRYLFVLHDLYHAMQNAAKSRLGYRSYRASIRATGGIYASLLSRSYRQAGKNYDAMESRCFNEKICFLEHRNKICGAHVAVALGIGALILGAFLFL